jgi:hypothetical protein
VNFKIHGLALALGFAALLGYGRLPAGQMLALGNFAAYGALHALCVVVSLGRGASLSRCTLFIVLAALADVGVMYLGFFSVGSLAQLLGTGSVYAALAVCALFGAIVYGLLLRAMLLPTLRPRRILQMAAGCTAVCLLAEAAGQLRGPGQVIWIVGAWWLAFSSGLWLVQRRFHAFGTQADA